MRGFEYVASESAGFAGPEGLCCVEACRLSAYGKALCEVFADGPGAFAEAPVVVAFVGAPVHHCVAADGPAMDRVVADAVHAVAWEDANRHRGAAAA